MKSSPIFPGDENVSCNEFDYDALDDFSKFLEEARKHAFDAKFESASVLNFPSKKKIEAQNRSKKSWKKLLFFWQKFEKSPPVDNILVIGTRNNKRSQISKPRGSVSGPIAAGRSTLHACRNGRPASGPLSGCFTEAQVDEEARIPYMWLDQINSPCRNQAFGPIYLVT